MTNISPDTRLKTIAIDTEYHCNEIGHIDRVYCIAATDRAGRQYKAWLPTGTDHTKVLDDILAYYAANADRTVFVCHAYEVAERAALKFLGVDLRAYHMACTFHIARMLSYTLDKEQAPDYTGLSDSERIQAEIEAKRAKTGGLSYAALCERYGLALIDTAHKEHMRRLCIDNATAGHEADILDYCADDTAHIIPLFDKLFAEYLSRLRHAYCPITDTAPFEDVTPTEALMLLVGHCDDMRRYGDIADRGLYVSADRVQKTRQNAAARVERLQKDFADVYPGTYTLSSSDGQYHENCALTQRLLAEDVARLRFDAIYPVTDSGKLSSSVDDLRLFANTEGFGHDYYVLRHDLRGLAYLMPAHADNNLQHVCASQPRLYYHSLNPFGTKSGRCAPRAKNFMFGWPKFLCGNLDSPVGRMRVELDFSSQETWLQAAICHDDSYMHIYQAGDIYLGFAVALGQIPKADFETMTTAALKKKYAAQRSAIKPMILGLSYGMGAATLATRCGKDITDARADKAGIEAAIATTTRFKAGLRRRFDCLTSAMTTPDGFVVQVTAGHEAPKTLTNWPFQAAGAYVLRLLLKEIEDDTDLTQRVQITATIHDAIFFEVDDGDNEAIEAVRQHMIHAAGCAVCHEVGTDDIKVGAPEIARHGEIWTPGHELDDTYMQLLNEGDDAGGTPTPGDTVDWTAAYTDDFEGVPF